MADTTAINGYYGPLFGQAFGQSFHVDADTVITAIKVWFQEGTNGRTPATMYITATDSRGAPWGGVAYASTTIYPVDDDPSHTFKVPMRFVFNPPVRLPGPGEYGFYLLGCSPYGVPWVAGVSTNNPYPLGMFWARGSKKLHDWTGRGW